MIRLRRVLGPIAAVWLVCQTATLGLAPGLLAWTATSDATLVECTCAHGADATCPMHHHKTGTDARPCVMQSTNGPAAVVLSSVFGLLGFLPEDIPSVTLTFGERTMPSESSDGIDRPAPPDPPPPRA